MLLRSTLWGTLVRSRILAINVNMQQSTLLIWRTTKRFTPGKSLTDARPASFLPQLLETWKATLQENMVKESLISVTNATSLLLPRLNCGFTWGHTQARDLSGATNALSHTQWRVASLNILKAIKTHSELSLQNQWLKETEKILKNNVCLCAYFNLIFEIN